MPPIQDTGAMPTRKDQFVHVDLGHSGALMPYHGSTAHSSDFHSGHTASFGLILLVDFIPSTYSSSVGVTLSLHIGIVAAQPLLLHQYINTLPCQNASHDGASSEDRCLHILLSLIHILLATVGHYGNIHNLGLKC